MTDPAPPPTPRTRVLVVDDEPTLGRSLARLLGLRGFDATATEDGEEAIRVAMAGDADVMLVDLRMPRVSGMDVLERVKRERPDVEVVMMTAHADVDTAVAAVKAGAYDFLTKPFPTADAVAISVTKAAEHRRLVGRTRELEDELEAAQQFGEIIGTSPKMRDVYRLVDGIAASGSTVLVLGETGTGKELIARAIHQRSPRASKPMVVVNCGAIPAELVESELFGHLKGTFTGAVANRVGLVESADGGTIFLDEVGDLPLPAQVKLLRFLQEGEVRKVGASEARTVDVRVVAATHVDLLTRVREGRFREDLYYRLNVIPLVLPPLRDRREDVALLASHFLAKYRRRTGKNVRRIAPDALRALESQPWPGNVRELENAIERAVVLARGEELTAADLSHLAPPSAEATPSSASPSRAPPPPSTPSVAPRAADGADGDPSLPAGWTPARYVDAPFAEARQRAMLEFERAYIDALLARTGGNISQAARAAGLDRSNFKRVLRRTRGAARGDDEGGAGDDGAS